MKSQEMWIDAGNKRKLFAKIWIPDEKPTAVITLVHGFGEHCTRYEPYFLAFNNEPIAFVSFDLYGHGKSDGKRGTIISYDSLLDDVALFINFTKEQFPNLSHYLYGHSMGGNIVLNYLLRRPADLTGAIVTSPWLKLTDEPPMILKKLVSSLRLVMPNVTFNSGLDVNAISSQADEVKKYRNDPLNHGRISFRLFHEIVYWGNWAMKNASELVVPTLLMHGTADKITSPLASERVFESNREKINFVSWEGKFHELHNENVRHKVAEAVIQWMHQAK
ncbi:MAG: lysophospholipase [Bacteroidetes bacterium HGW-Bacteroidetes-4]|jgi:alpha-beta hydrolase superfamily lysophospholipase|nr:MAG: lysophospholipase [Bacteroidetes bacterium HGW-Bacteroidetes-4]